MKVKILIILSILLIALSVSCFLYPNVSKEYEKQKIETEIQTFDTKVEEISEGTHKEAVKKKEINEEGYPINEEGSVISDTPVIFKGDIDKLLKDSKYYNENLKENQKSLLVDEYSYAYPSIDLTEYGIYDGIFGYIESPTINMKLPIYLGANDGTMSNGAAHLTYTSLPIGGESTNCVLAAHTGYIGKIFFDYIFNLSIGDKIYITNYWDILEYKVVKTEVHAPNDSDSIFIQEGKDLVTLLTCISDGYGGFNRYYVICERC